MFTALSETRTGRVLQPRQTVTGKTSPPLAHRLFGRLQFVGDFFVGPIQGGEQDDAGTQHFSLTCARCPGESFQLLALHMIQYDFRRGARHPHTLK